MMRRIAYILLVLLVVFMAGLYWLVTTQSGLDFALQKTQKYFPELSVDSAEGQLAGRLKMQNIHYTPESGMQVSVKSLDLDWLPWALISGQLLMEQFHIAGLELTEGQAADTANNDAALPEVVLPISVSIRSLRVTQAVLNAADGSQSLLFDRLDTRFRMSQDRLVISDMNLNRPELAFMLSGEARLSAPYPVNLNYGMTVYLPDIKPISVTGTVDGDKRHLNVHQQVGEPLASQQDITLSHIFDNFSWRLESNSQLWELADLNADENTRLLGMRASGGGDLERANINISGVVEHQNYPAVSMLSRFETRDFSDWYIDSDFHISEAVFASLDGVVRDVTNQPQADLKLRWHNLAWPLEPAADADIQTSGVMQIAGGMDNFTAGLDASLEAFQENIGISGHFAGNPRALEIQTLRLRHRQGSLSLNGQLALANTFKYALNAQWRDLQIPEQFLADTAISTSRGNLQLDGENDIFRVRSRSDLTIDALPLQLDIQANSQETGLAQVNLKADSGNGKLNLDGHVDWRHDPAAEAKIQFEQIDPARFAPDLPGNLAGSLDVDVAAPEKAPPAVSIKDMHIFGELAGNPIDLKAALDYQQSLAIQDLTLRSGESSLSAQGEIADTAAISFAVNAPSLTDFYPALAGRLQGEGEITGKTTEPTLTLNLSGDNIQYADTFQLATLSARGQLSAEPGKTSDLALAASDLQFADTRLAGLHLNIDGLPQKHTIRLQADSSWLDLTSRFAGGWNGEQWQGQLNQLDLVEDRLGKWQLAQPANLRLAADAQQLEAFCWQSARAEQICLDWTQDAQQRWQLQTNISELDVARLNPLSADYAEFSGALNADIALQKDTNATVGKADIVIDSLAARPAAELEKQDPVDFSEFSLKADFSNEGSELSLTIAPDLAGVEPLSLTAQTADLDTLMAAPRDTPINAQIQSRIAQLSALAFISPDFEALQGELALDADIGGTVNQPAAEGRLSLRNGQVAVEQLGIVLKSLEVDVDGDLHEGIDFIYQAQSGNGSLEGEGEFTMAEQSWQMQTTLSGQQMEVMHLPEAYVVASPELSLSISPGSAALSGDLVIPEAELAPLEFNSSVAPSRDVEIVGAQAPPAETLATDVNVRVKLGDDVRITGLGFEGRLTGDLEVVGDAGEILTGNGEITITDGIYEAYGQKLTVDNGKIRFSGAAIDNPQLDIRAVRTGRDFIAGLHIQGPAASPQATLFSEPPMSQDNILAHILLGRSIDSASGDDAAMLASAATSMGIRNGNMLGQEIASSFGLDEFRISGDDADNAALQIGKYLSPKLYLGYGIGVFEPVSTVQLRYQLNQIWSLQAESGTESGVDLLYIYER